MLSNKSSFGGVFTATCYDKDGKLKWEEEFPNLVVNVGLQFINQQLFLASGYTATWFMGLVNTGGVYNAANTMSAHVTWTENTDYLQSTRPLITFITPTTANPSVTVSDIVTFTINGNATIAGAFLTTSSTKAGTTGTLLSVGNFTVGDRGLVSGDTLNVTYTFSANAV